MGSEEDRNKVEAMKGFLKHHFNTEQVQKINIEDLKHKINGAPLVGRLKYRQGGSKKQLVKNEIYRFEGTHSKLLALEHQNEDFGFNCLNFAVSESSGYISIKVQNKKKSVSQVGVRTVNLVDGALPEKDFTPVDYIIKFDHNDQSEVQIKIIDDEQWEPDKEFAVELYDPETGLCLS